MHNIVPVRAVGQRIPDRIQHRGFPAALGAGISTEPPPSDISRIPNMFLITIFVVFIDKTHFLSYYGDGLD
jgi:hypothetical protein